MRSTYHTTGLTFNQGAIRCYFLHDTIVQFLRAVLGSIPTQSVHQVHCSPRILPSLHLCVARSSVQAVVCTLSETIAVCLQRMRVGVVQVETHSGLPVQTCVCPRTDCIRYSAMLAISRLMPSSRCLCLVVRGMSYCSLSLEGNSPAGRSEPPAKALAGMS